MKTSTIKYTILALALATMLGACGGGGSDKTSGEATKALAEKRAKPPGFADIDGSGYINAAIQLIASDERLRQVVHYRAGMSWIGIFLSIDDRQPKAKLERRHELLVAQIRKLDISGFGPNKPAYTFQVLEKLGIELTPADGAAAIEAAYAQGKRDFNVASAAAPEKALLSYADIPKLGELNGFVYVRGADTVEGRRFVAYVRKGGKWFEVDNKHVKQVDDVNLNSLAVTRVLLPSGELDLARSTGIHIVSYR
jgi:hypothetical protein